MATKTKTETDRPLSARIDEHRAEADQLAAEARAARDRAGQLEQEKTDRELAARRAWSEAGVARRREIFAVPDQARRDAVAALRAGQSDAHGLWLRWRAAETAAGGEWGVIAATFEQSHGQRAPAGRTFSGGGPGKSAERFEDFAHRLSIEVSTEAGTAARQRALADLAAVVGSTDLDALADSVTPAGTFFRGRVVPDAAGNPTDQVVPWPGTLAIHPWRIYFDATGHCTVYEQALADLLDTREDCARVEPGVRE